MYLEPQQKYRDNVSSYRTTYQSRYGPALTSRDQSHIYNRSSNVIQSQFKSRRNNSHVPYVRSSYVSKRSDGIEEQPFPPMSVYDTEAPVSQKEINQEIGINSLERENKELKSELHRLRKIQAGWFGKEKQKVVEKVKVEHHHYLDEKKVLIEKCKNLEIERDQLTEQNNVLKSELDGFKKSKIVNVQTSIVEQSSNKNVKEIETLRNQLKNIENEKTKLIDQHKLEIQKIKSQADQQTNFSTTKVEQNYATIVNLKNGLENQLIEKNRIISDLNHKNSQLENHISTLQTEINNYQKNVYNTNIKVETQNDSQQIIDRYKQKLEERNSENQRLKQQVNDLKDKIHQVTLEKQIMETKSSTIFQNPENKKLQFDLESLKNENEFQKLEIKKLKEIISKAKDQPAHRTVHVTEEYQTYTNNNNSNFHNSNYQRNNFDDYNNSTYISNHQY